MEPGENAPLIGLVGRTCVFFSFLKLDWGVLVWWETFVWGNVFLLFFFGGILADMDCGGLG